MKVKIVSARHDSLWYAKRIGDVVEVKRTSEEERRVFGNYGYRVCDSEPLIRFIHARDAIELDGYTLPILSATALLSKLTASYEYYAACNKPKEEWDEYDQAILPIWLEVKEFLKNENP